MGTELAALAKAGAATLVALMTSDLWTQARDGFARLFARNATAGTRAEHLEASRADLAIAHAAGDAAAAALIQAEWQARMISSCDQTRPQLRSCCACSAHLGWARRRLSTTSAVGTCVTGQ
jgi:hypothetical protein